MLKEGWDVTNLYTIVPLRAANARILIEQSIGRGLRLPYGKRTGVSVVDRLNIIAHDKFDEIVQEARREDSPIQLKQLVISGKELEQQTITVVSQSQLASKLGIQPAQAPSVLVAPANAAPVFSTPAEQQIAQITYNPIRKLESKPETAPTTASLQTAEVQALVAKEVASQYRPSQLELPGITATIDIAAIVAQT